ncbi:MAG: polysaccharide biosynthesis tyrosine autokinase [Pseudomonadota bacterium]|nr:polysaccharide biosynthesis tyrosine autokinase [Pseudomonadota bacterium]MDE3038423.1 polysaccharide biosynthesis tyrosine autokinase [Pseudomonadota bacterium]
MNAAVLFPDPIAQTTHEAPPGTISMREAVLFLQRNKRVMFAVLVAVMIFTVVFVLSQTPLYTATTTLEINVNPEKVIDFQSVTSSIDADEDQIISELDIIQSRPLAEKIIKQLDLEHDAEFNPRPWFFQRLFNWLYKNNAAAEQAISAQEHERILERFQKRLTAKRKPKSYIIEIAFTSRSPEKARRIADAVAEGYIASQLENKFSAMHDANNWLSRKLTDLQANLTASERKVQKFKEQNHLLENAGMMVTQQQFSELNSQLILARAAVAQAQAKLQNAKISPDSTPEVLNSYLIQLLRNQEAELLRKKADLSTRYGPKHPSMININAQVADLDHKIRSEIAKIIKSLETEVSVASDREAALAKNLQMLQGETGQDSRASVQLAELVREMDANRTLYESFLTRFKQTSEGNGDEQPDARIVSQAETPRTPSYPRMELVFPIALIMGMFLAVLTAVALEALDNSFRSGHALEQDIHLPIVGMLPELADKKMLHESSVAYIESLKSAYISMGLRKGNVPQVMLISSSIPGEGKTFFSYSFARMLAKSGKKILLIDADLKRSQLSQRLLRDKCDHGLNDVINGDVMVKKVMMKDETFSLDFIPCRPGTGDSQELLVSAAMKALITRMRQAYDHIILDTAPLMAVSDGLVIAKLADMCLFLVRWGHTPRQVVKTAMQSLLPAGTPISLLVTRIDTKKLSAYDAGAAGYYYEECKNYSG